MIKKIIANVLLFLFLAFNAYAGGAVGLMVAGGSATAPAGCNPASNEIGQRSTYSTDYALAANIAIAVLSTADCSGELDTAYFYSTGEMAGNRYCKMCIYSTTGSAATPNNAGNTLIKCSNTITATNGSAGWKSAVMDASGNVTSGTQYWLVFTISTDGSWYQTKRNATTTIYYLSDSGYYASPPANLQNASWSSAGSFGDFSGYISIK